MTATKSNRPATIVTHGNNAGVSVSPIVVHNSVSRLIILEVCMIKTDETRIVVVMVKTGCVSNGLRI